MLQEENMGFPFVAVAVLVADGVADGAGFPSLLLLLLPELGFAAVAVGAVGVGFLSPLLLLLLPELRFAAERIVESGSEPSPNCDFNLLWRDLCHAADLLTPFEIWWPVEEVV